VTHGQPQPQAKRWWIVDDAGGSWACYQAPTARQAIARNRQDRVDAEVAGGVSRRAARRQLAALDLAVAAGPLTVAEACAWETEQALAEAQERRAIYSAGQRGLTEHDRRRITTAIAAKYQLTNPA
jgi:hypothetical protein